MKPYLWLIKFIGVIVPRRLRADWRQEWEAELRSREMSLADWDKLNRRNKLDLLRRSVGALRDALLLQPRRLEDEMFQDLRYGAMMLLKNPGFTLIAILTLALGIGVNTALFTVYNSFLLKPLPLKDPDSIVSINGYNREGQRNRLFSYQDYLDYRDRNTVFAGLVAMNQFLAPFGDQPTTVDESAGLPGNIGLGRLVSGNYFEVLGAEMALGRGFTPEEDRAPNTHPVVVLSHTCWERLFDSDPNIVGKTVRLAGLPFTIVGVTAKSFIGTEPVTPQFWAPLMMRDQVEGRWQYKRWLNERDADAFLMVGRLKPGATLGQAQAEMNVITRQLADAYPGPERKTSVIAIASPTFIQLDDNIKLLVAPVLTAIGLILLIACVNVTNMLLARATGRGREIAVRLALGAGRWRVIRQLLNESILLSALGGAAGILLTVWAIRALYPLVLAQLPVPPAHLEQFSLDLSPDYRVLSFTLLVSLLAGLAAGLAPALQASRPDLSRALKDEGSTFGARLSQSRLRNALVVTQVAVCLTLLIAAGLLTRNLQKLRTIDTGLVTGGVFTINTSAGGAQRESARVNEFCRRLAARLRSAPGVKSVSQARQEPFSSPTRKTPITLDGQTQTGGGLLQAGFNFVSADYFQTLGLRVTRGRAFTAQEEQSNAQVILISESTARRFWPNEDAIGKRIGIGVAAQQPESSDVAPNFPRYEVIGVTNDTRQGVIWRRDETFLYVPLPATQANTQSAGEYLIVKTEGDARTVMAAALNDAKALDSKIYIIPRLLSAWLDLQMTPFKAVAGLAGVLGLLALLLASIGLYGVMSFVVGQRKREIGVRMALGAQGRDIVSLFLRQGGKLIAAGVALGLAGGAAISGLLAVALVDISQFDPLAFCGVAAFLTLIALIACYLPARRATKVDPVVALRTE